ncbi:hypothetical protein [Longimicrobium terrae]|uniref:Uncharacterized protein n=1 Tax=Longimicrobium terrae TaxID=1639882 RepID=A0A841GZJ8_9BACT|nr:hypothetical protein [Longimicrobium terrae]MBB4636817.1 hypothetical protein [Longimicrobium terrae]MBB6071183.1 hypothetical protein [Longimicrobium terrae]NNC29232.1 hypothetical protein [Longimicrobium terrae]
MNRSALDLNSLAVESFATGDPAASPSTTLAGNSPLCGPSAFDSCETQC